MMKIPTSFTLGGLTWKVRLMKRLPGRYGECQLSKTTIQLLDKDVTQELQEQTFCHELVHSILFAMGKPQEEHDEHFIDAFATFLHQYMTTAKHEDTD
jgi:predicted SprT family Zn-dependent metalloprotease